MILSHSLKPSQMDFDFPIDWNMPDAVMICQKEYDDVRFQPNKRNIRALNDKGLMLTKSIEFLNDECMDELEAYREALVYGNSPKDREQSLDALYTKYQENFPQTWLSRIWRQLFN